MLAWLRKRRLANERRRLDVLYLRLLEQARDLQRNGDIRGFAAKVEEATQVERQIDAWIARETAPRPPDAH